ncbi:MAG: T9SS type A sorting domain-containing protein [Flavobacteriales bacterium]
MKILSYILFLLLIAPSSFSQCAKFEPPDGTAILILGQDLGSVGGFSSPNNKGYIEKVGAPVPGGVTTYLSIPSLAGMTSITNYGAGDICAQCITDNATYKNSVLSIGLYLVDELGNINKGLRDGVINQLATWIKGRTQPVFLRIGYEYDGSWNKYNAAEYKLAYKRIVDKFRTASVNNCAYVWQGAGYATDTTFLKQWYPGDDYVDWMAYSHFKYASNGSGEIALARAHHKPVMIAEATPRGDIIAPGYSWDTWFAPLFQHIQDNKDVIKALAYINANWNGQWMWSGQGWGDTRIENSSTIKAKWLAEISSSFWLTASPNLFATLDCSDTATTLPQNNLHVFPNPSNGEINIEFVTSSSKEIVITNLNGETLFSKSSSDNNPTKINTENFASGMYIISVKSENEIVQKKITVIH